MPLLPRTAFLVLIVGASMSPAIEATTIFSNVPVSPTGPSFCLPCDEDAVAVLFTPTENLYLSQIQLALTNVEFTNAAVISVVNDDGSGLPGSQTLESWTVTDLPNHATTFPNPPLTAVTDITGFMLSANTPYWVMVGGVGDSYNAWATGSTGYTPTAVHANGMWQAIGPYTPALVVTGSDIANAAPEPRTLLLGSLVVGIVMTCQLRRRRRNWDEGKP